MKLSLTLESEVEKLKILKTSLTKEILTIRSIAIRNKYYHLNLLLTTIPLGKLYTYIYHI